MYQLNHELAPDKVMQAIALRENMGFIHEQLSKVGQSGIEAMQNSLLHWPYQFILWGMTEGMPHRTEDTGNIPLTQWEELMGKLNLTPQQRQNLLTAQSDFQQVLLQYRQLSETIAQSRQNVPLFNSNVNIVMNALLTKILNPIQNLELMKYINQNSFVIKMLPLQSQQQQQHHIPQHTQSPQHIIQQSQSPPQHQQQYHTDMSDATDAQSAQQQSAPATRGRKKKQ
eukprot:UN02591